MKPLVRLYILKGFTAETLGKAIGVSATSIYKYSSGEVYPKQRIFQKMTEVLGVSVNDLYMILRGGK